MGNINYLSDLHRRCSYVEVIATKCMETEMDEKVGDVVSRGSFVSNGTSPT